jgi:hypothetical protein
MNKILIIGVIILVLVGGYVLYSQNVATDAVDPVGIEDNEDEAAQTPEEKIDPQVACESALAYMTFESGEDAEAFVEACVNGEHPEVIERYINDMGLDGASI